MLKPCPFCGGSASFHSPEDGPVAGGTYIECIKCKASSVCMFAEKSDVHGLLSERWNTRAAKKAIHAPDARD